MSRKSEKQSMPSVRTWTKSIEPRDFTDVYSYVQNQLEDFSKLIDQWENDYYQAIINNQTNRFKRPLPIHALTLTGKLLNDFVTSGAVRSISNAKTMRDLLVQSRAGTTLTNVSEDHISLMNRIIDKSTDQLHIKIPNLADRINDCMRVMEQYFLSFYEIENVQDYITNKKKEKPPDEYIETAYVYERSRCLHLYQVSQSLKILYEMKQRTEDPKGIGLTSLSKECQELALRCNGTSLSFVYALPECYIEARRSVTALRTWLNQDNQYLGFIESSLSMLDEKSNEINKAFELSRVHLNQMEHRLHSFKIQLNRAEEENEINEKKRLELEERLNDKEREYLSKRLTHEVYEDQLKKLMKNTDGNQDEFDQTLSIEKFQREVKQLGQDLPKLKSQIESIQSRLKYFQEKQEELSQMKNENKKIEKDLQNALEEKILKENEHKRVNTARKILQRIEKCRASNDLPQKIFYDLPLESRRSVENDDDDLSKGIRLTSKLIGRDWNRLYWNLPFYPARGQHEIDKDIHFIDDKYHRGDVFHEQAKDALNKWRRFHTRAKLDDLIKALKKINRLDVFQQIDLRIIKPKLSLNIQQESIDPRKKEIEELNQKLNTLFEKLRTGVITTHDTYVYSTIGLDPLKPFIKRKRNNQTSNIGSTITTSKY